MQTKESDAVPAGQFSVGWDANRIPDHSAIISLQLFRHGMAEWRGRNVGNAGFRHIRSPSCLFLAIHNLVREALEIVFALQGSLIE